MGQKGIRILAWNLLVGLIFLEVAAQIYRVAKSPYQPFLKTEIMSEIKNYLKYVNHSRDQRFPLELQKVSKKPVNYGEPSIYIFSEYREKNSDKPVLLLQGDSWAEGLEENALDAFLEMASVSGLELIAAGTTSFSPTNMASQLRFMKSRGINVASTIAFIDQTDLGDESCRYKRQAVFNSEIPETIALVKPYQSHGQTVFEYGPLVSMNEMPLMAPRLLAEMIYRVRRLLNDVRGSKACSWDEIRAPLLRPDSQQIEYFTRALRAYINTHAALYPDANLNLITHPHRGHLNGEYKYEIGSTVKATAAEFDWVNHLALGNFDLKREALTLHPTEMFETGDPASHPTKAGYQLIGELIYLRLNKSLSG